MSAAIVCVGVHILDTLAVPIDEVPKQQNSVRVQQILHAAGGTAAGVAVDIAHLGQAVSTIGVVGADDTGRFLLDLMAAKGVDISAVTALASAQTSSSVLLVDSFGNRPALHVRGVHALAEWQDLNLAPLDDARFVHFGGLDALSSLGRAEAVTMMRNLRARGVYLSLDFQSSAQHLVPELLELVAEVDVFLPNDEQAAGLTGVADVNGMAQALLATGVRQVVITCGADGIHYSDHETTFHVDAFETAVVDTTGCGDSVVATYITALARGHRVHEALTLAAAAGAAVASGVGSLGGLPDWDELCRRVEIDSMAPIGAEGVK